MLTASWAITNQFRRKLNKCKAPVQAHLVRVHHQLDFINSSNFLQRRNERILHQVHRDLTDKNLRETKQNHFRFTQSSLRKV